jgi:tetratricopeptide (TPR) repeat protein
MQKHQVRRIDQKLDCQRCRERLPDFLAQTLSLEERQAVGSHLRECEECFNVYADLVDERIDEDDKSLYIGDRPLWGPLMWGLEEDEEYLQELLFLAHQQAENGGVVLVKHHPIQEKSLLLLFCALSVQLRREGKQVLFANPSATDALIPLLEQAKESVLYLLASEGTQTADFDLFLQALALHNQTSAGKVVALIGAGREYGKEEEPEKPLTPEVYAIPCPDMDEELTRFKRRLGEEAAAIREELTKVDAVTNKAYALVGLLDARNIPMPLALLARLLDLPQAEAAQIVDQARGLLFWVDSPHEGSKELISTAAPALARQFLPPQEELLEAYGSLIEAASQEQARLLIVRLLRRLIQQGCSTLARGLIRQHRETLTALWQEASAQEHVLYGKILWSVGEKPEAERIYRQGYERDPDNMYLLHALAVVLGKTAERNNTEAEAYFERLSRLPGQENNPYVWQAWAEHARRRGSLVKAEEYFKKALEVAPDNVPLLVGYANLERDWKEGKYGEHRRKEAENLLLRAREIDYRNVYALHSLGVLEKQRAQYADNAWRHLQEATHYFQTVLRIDPYNLPALNALATLEKERGHLRQAKAYLERALAIDDENLHCLTAWGELWTSVYKDFDHQDAGEKAEEAFRKALAVEEQNAHALVGYARLLSLLRRDEEVETCLTRVWELYGNRPETVSYIHTIRGEMALRQGKEKQAIREFEAAQQKGVVAAYTELAKVAAMDNLPWARRLLQKARDNEPNNVIIYNTEAALEAKYGDTAKAQAAFEQSLAIDPDNAYTHWRYAQLLEKRGEQEKASLHYQQADALGLFLKGESQMDTDEAVLNDDTLYERYGKPLEREHHGKYIAISRDGRVIVDSNDLSVIGQAINAFGSGNFVFRRIGYSYVWKVRWGHVGQRGLSVSAGKSHYP